MLGHENIFGVRGVVGAQKSKAAGMDAQDACDDVSLTYFPDESAVMCFDQALVDQGIEDLVEEVAMLFGEAEPLHELLSVHRPVAFTAHELLCDPQKILK